MNKNNIKIGIMGSSQIQHIIPVLIESRYHVTNIQSIWQSNENKSVKGKEKLYRDTIRDCDILYNIYSKIRSFLRFATPACRTTDSPRPRISPEEMPCQLLTNTIHPRHIHSDGGESVKTDRFTLFIL